MTEPGTVLRNCGRASAVVLLFWFATSALGDEPPFTAALRRLVGHTIEIVEKSSDDRRTVANLRRAYAVEGTTGCTVLLRISKSFRSTEGVSWSSDDIYTIPFSFLDQGSVWLDDEGDLEKTTWEPHVYLACGATLDRLSTISVAGTINGEKSQRQESTFCISFANREAATEMVELIKHAVKACREPK